MQFETKMPYFGRLSVNSMKIVRGGRRTHHNWSEVDEWMSMLANRVSHLRGKLQSPVKVYIFGHFKDERHPDLDNLFKVVMDGLKLGLGIDDKFFIPIAEGYSTGYEEPVLLIKVEADSVED